MKQLAMVVGCALVGFLAWFMASRLSSDALSMAVGIVFGLLAGIPTLLLVLVSQRRREQDDDDDGYRQEAGGYLARYQPPVIVLAAPGEQQPTAINYTYNDNRQVNLQTPAAGMPLLADREREITAERGGRVFKVVGGERAEWDGDA